MTVFGTPSNKSTVLPTPSSKEDTMTYRRIGITTRRCFNSSKFRELVTLELYEGYFPPKRHKFELQLLRTLVDAVASSQSSSFLAGVALGVAGNAVYDMLKKALAYAVRKLGTVQRSRNAFQEIEDNLDKIRSYFEKRDQVRADKLCADLGLERHKLEPLLKLLGFRCHRRKKRQVWSRPVSWKSQHRD